MHCRSAAPARPVRVGASRIYDVSRETPDWSAIDVPSITNIMNHNLCFVPYLCVQPRAD